MDYPDGSSPGRWDFMSWSWTLGRVAGIRIRLHLLFIIFVVFRLLNAAREGEDFGFELSLVTLVFGCVLLHEFGHCFGCRAVGGQADDILLWPLGGLAFVDPPHRPYENLMTTLAGPAVNVVICLGLLPVLYAWGAVDGSIWNPFSSIPWYESYGFLYLAFRVNYWLLLFNLLPIFPFDGGRILQELLWFKIGYHRATVIATSIGMIGGILMAGISIWRHDLMLTGIALFGFVTCLQVRRELELMGEVDNEFGYDFSEGFTSFDQSTPSESRSKKTSLRSKFRAWFQERRERSDTHLETELDRILEKIHANGMKSLTRYEKKLLSQASKKRQEKL